MNFIKSRFGVRSIRRLKSCKKIWIIGWKIIIINELTKGKCAVVEHRWKHCLREKRQAKRKLGHST